PDVLEPDRRLVRGDPVALAEPPGGRRVVVADDRRLAHPAVLGEVVHQQARDLELVDERALLVGRTRAVRVAVEEQAQVVAAALDDPERLVDPRTDPLGVDAAEERVALLVDLGDPDLAAGQQPRDPARAGAVHRLHEDGDSRWTYGRRGDR